MTTTCNNCDDERADIIVGPDGEDRRVAIDRQCGEVFAEGKDFDGLTLTIEVKSEEEADAICALLDAHGRAGTYPVPINWPVKHDA